MNFKHSRLSQLSRLHKAPRGTSVHAIAAPVPANSAYQKDTASQKDLPSITKHDMGKRSSQEELDRYLKSYVSSQVERVKYIPQEHITVRPLSLNLLQFRIGARCTHSACKLNAC